MKVALSEPRNFFLNSWYEKNMLKTFNSISLMHAGSYGGVPSVMSHPLRAYETIRSVTKPVIQISSSRLIFRIKAEDVVLHLTILQD